MRICGIDEAGRGPVIGPMVMAGIIIESGDEEKLLNMGVKDSKFLTPKKREEIFSKLIENYQHKIVVYLPKQIDAALASETMNLNWLEAEGVAEILNSLKCDKTFVDCPSNNIQAYTDYFSKKVNYAPEIVCEHKADTNYVVVGAASIIAKVTRDREVDKLKKSVREDFGSGYPSDPKTKEFLANNYDKYDFFRKSWSSYKKAAEKENQSNLFSFQKQK